MFRACIAAATSVALLLLTACGGENADSQSASEPTQEPSIFEADDARQLAAEISFAPGFDPDGGFALEVGLASYEVVDDGIVVYGTAPDGGPVVELVRTDGTVAWRADVAPPLDPDPTDRVSPTPRLRSFDDPADRWVVLMESGMENGQHTARMTPLRQSDGEQGAVVTFDDELVEDEAGEKLTGSFASAGGDGMYILHNQLNLDSYDDSMTVIDPVSGERTEVPSVEGQDEQFAWVDSPTSMHDGEVVYSRGCVDIFVSDTVCPNGPAYRGEALGERTWNDFSIPLTRSAHGTLLGYKNLDTGEELPLSCGQTYFDNALSPNGRYLVTGTHLLDVQENKAVCMDGAPSIRWTALTDDGVGYGSLLPENATSASLSMPVSVDFDQRPPMVTQLPDTELPVAVTETGHGIFAAETTKGGRLFVLPVR